MTKEVAVIQSNYIPWKGYFDAINSVDEFVLFDCVQYTRRDWRNRNKIKTPNGLQWLTIPVEVKGKFEQLNQDTRVSDSKWSKEHHLTLVHNYSRAACYQENEEWLKSLYQRAGELEFLSDVNYLFLSEICKKLEITTPLRRSEELEIIDGKSERLLSICKQLGARKYWSGPAAKVYLDESIFNADGIEVGWIEYPKYSEYPQLHPPFEHGLSVLDVILNCGTDAAEFVKVMPHSKVPQKAER